MGPSRWCSSTTCWSTFPTTRRRWRPSIASSSPAACWCWAPPTRDRGGGNGPLAGRPRSAHPPQPCISPRLNRGRRRGAPRDATSPRSSIWAGGRRTGGWTAGCAATSCWTTRSRSRVVPFCGARHRRCTSLRRHDTANGGKGRGMELTARLNGPPQLTGTALIVLCGYRGGCGNRAPRSAASGRAGALVGGLIDRATLLGLRRFIAVHRDHFANPRDLTYELGLAEAVCARGRFESFELLVDRALVGTGPVPAPIGRAHV